MPYASIPKELNIKEIIDKGHILSPLHYQRLRIGNNNTVSVRDFLDRDLKPKDKGIEIGSQNYISKSSHFFISTKALQPDSFLPNLTRDSCIPIFPSVFKNYDLKADDILISKDSNIGESVMLDKDMPNYMLSGGIYRLPISNLKYYLLAFMNNEFFKTQLQFLRGATIRHAKTLFLNCIIPFPNQQNKDNIITYVELLTQAAINKEREINRKYQLIMNIFESELLGNQKANTLKYENPNIKEIRQSLRLDTGIYSQEYKSFKHIIDNYLFGANNLSLGFKTKRGQNLQVSCIGRSIYSDDPKNNFFKLITSGDLTEYGTHKPYRYLGNTRRNLQRVNHGDIMFSATGQAITSVGKVCVFINPPSNLISNINSFFLYKDDFNLEENIYVAMTLLYYKYKQYLIKMIGYGNGGSFTEHHFSLIDIPDIPSTVRTKIVRLYHNPVSLSLPRSTLSDFLNNDIEWNNQVGISELDNSLKKITVRLSEVIDKIVSDKEVEIVFGFLA